MTFLYCQRAASISAKSILTPRQIPTTGIGSNEVAMSLCRWEMCTSTIDVACSVYRPDRQNLVLESVRLDGHNLALRMKTRFYRSQSHVEDVLGLSVARLT